MNRNVKRTAAVAALAATALLGGTGFAEARTSAPQRHTPAAHAGIKSAAPLATRAETFDKVTELAKAHGRIRVTLALADAPTTAPTAGVRARLTDQATHGRAAALRVLHGHGNPHSVPGAPAMSATLTASQVERLRAEPAVLSVSPSVDLTPAGTSSFGAASGVQLPKWWHQKRMGLDWTYANGYTGAGQKVVIIDTGVAANHPWLSGHVVDGACFSHTGCANGQSYQYGVSAAAPCTYAHNCAHGTHVAHIAAGKYGAAPAAKIVAIKAASKGTDSYGRPSAKFWDDDEINALWYAYTYVSPAPAAVNMSIGGGLHSGTCDTLNPELTKWVSALRARGTATVIAAGNDDSSTSISAPACISSAVVVGNATLTSATGTPAVLAKVWGGSNSNSLVDLWAPGTDICSAVPVSLDFDGKADGVDCTKYGTSMATPQVTGAFAVMKAAWPTYTVSQSLTALVRNGLAITDSRNGITRSMISISNAVYYG